MEESKPEWIPCRRGCSWCCWSLNVLITWIEAYHVLAEVKKWDESRLAALAKQARSEVEMLLSDPVIAKFASGGDVDPRDLGELNLALKRHIRPCPLLNRQTGECQVYNERFLTCRTFGHTAIGKDNEFEGFYCQVVNEDVAKHEEVNLYNARVFADPLYHMAGAPNVIALPISFWIEALVTGGEENRGYSLTNPEPLFAEMLHLFNPIEVIRKDVPETTLKVSESTG